MEDRKYTRYEQQLLRAGFLDLMYTAREANLYLNPKQQARVKAAWDLVRDKSEPPLKFYCEKPSPIIMPSSAAYVPKVKAPGVPGVSGA